MCQFQTYFYQVDNYPCEVDVTNDLQQRWNESNFKTQPVYILLSFEISIIFIAAKLLHT